MAERLNAEDIRTGRGLRLDSDGGEAGVGEGCGLEGPQGLAAMVSSSRERLHQ
jgi:hypothetical protein